MTMHLRMRLQWIYIWEWTRVLSSFVLPDHYTILPRWSILWCSVDAGNWLGQNKLLWWEMGDYVNKEVVSTKCFGVQTDDALKWDHHVLELAKSFTQKLNLLKSLYFLLRQARTDFYFGVILPSVAYGMLVWGSCTAVKYFSQNLESTHVSGKSNI